MFASLSLYLTIGFLFTTILAMGMVFCLFNTSAKPISKKSVCSVMVTIILWLSFQASMSLLGIYTDYPESIPPKIILFGVIPALITIVVLFVTRKGRLFIDRLSMQMLTYIHIIRIPVELVLYGLFLNGTVPELMTFQGHNFDILAGITAPLVGFFGIGQSKMGKFSLLTWNFVCLGLLLNIVISAILSTPSPFQQFGFDQPNIAILNFPFGWLPTFIVPLVMFAHLAAIRKLIKHMKPIQ